MTATTTSHSHTHDHAETHEHGYAHGHEQGEPNGHKHAEANGHEHDEAREHGDAHRHEYGELNGHEHAEAHGHGHGHGRAPVAPVGVMAYLNGEPVSRELLDDRLAAVRAGDAACVLPRPDSREGRQLTRWVAQVVLTEQLCLDELRHHASVVPETPTGPHDSRPDTAGGPHVGPRDTPTGPHDSPRDTPGGPHDSRPYDGRSDTAGGPHDSPRDTAGGGQGGQHGMAAGLVGGVGAEPIDVSTAIAVGSITAAALAGSEAVRRVAALVTADVRIPAEQLAYAADVLGEEAPADPGVPVAGWHRELLQSARLEAFARWLNAAMYERVQLVRGLEHPGDSNQPDNLHRH